VKRRGLLLLVATAGCKRSRPKLGAFTQGALAVAHELAHSSSAECAWARDELASIAEQVRALHEPGQPSLARSLRRALFGELGFVREVAKPELDFVLLPSVLRGRRGSCVGLGGVYLALAEALGLAAHGVLMPGHFYVRQAEADGPRGLGAPSNVELLRRGELMPAAWYQARFPVPAGTAGYYARALSSSEAHGVIAFDIGNEQRRAQRLADARDAYQRATQLFPGFADAHASLGAALHLLGRYDAAAASYQAAHTLNPELAGLRNNMTLLEAERSR
jgi:regulator of sirC expression with transglutaminase-like and TPR domain